MVVTSKKTIVPDRFIVGDLFLDDSVMRQSRKELLLKLQSLINHYGDNENFIAHMDEWPKTIRRLVFDSEKLMAQLDMLAPIPKIEPTPSSTQNILSLCKSGHHCFQIIYTTQTTVIRWCEVCGSIVGDMDSDNRTYPGVIFEMKSPDISKKVQSC